MVLNINTTTPLEEYKIKGRSVWVKRDDLMGDNVTIPAWGKIGAVYELVSKYVDRSKPLCHLVIPGSFSGWALAAICEDLGIEFYYCYSDSSKASKESIDYIKQLYPNTHMVAIMPNVLQVMKGLTKQVAEKVNGQFLPYAFNHDYYKNYLTERIKPIAKDFDNLVVSSGSAVTLSGLAYGFLEEELNTFFCQSKRKIWTNAVSTERGVKRELNKNGLQFANIELNISEYELQDKMEWYETPFPCNELWDKKQWYWLEQNIDKIEGTILFWNLGGNYNFK